MATIKEILSEQVKLLSEAKKTLEAGQRRPPSLTAPIAAKQATVAELKSRAANVSKAKADAVKEFDEQLESYKTEIAALEKQIEEDKKRLGDDPQPPRARGSGRKN
jgi:predicted RNase H-like nuclease (RuvC/YqgF family)